MEFWRERAHYFKSQRFCRFTFLALGEEHHSPGAPSMKLTAVSFKQHSLCKTVALLHFCSDLSTLFSLERILLNKYSDRGIFLYCNTFVFHHLLQGCICHVSLMHSGFVIVLEGLKTYSPFWSLRWSAKLKRSGQCYCIDGDFKRFSKRG